MRALSAPLAFEDPTNSQRIRGGSFRMKRTQYRIQPQTREALARRLAEELEKEPAVRLAISMDRGLTLIPCTMSTLAMLEEFRCLNTLQ
jgi:hypothetical protein